MADAVRDQRFVDDAERVMAGDPQPEIVIDGQPEPFVESADPRMAASDRTIADEKQTKFCRNSDPTTCPVAVWVRAGHAGRPSRVDDRPPSENDAKGRVGPESVKLPLQFRRLPQIVGVQKRDERGVGQLDADVAGVRHAAILLPDEPESSIR